VVEKDKLTIINFLLLNGQACHTTSRLKVLELQGFDNDTTVVEEKVSLSGESITYRLILD